MKNYFKKNLVTAFALLLIGLTVPPFLPTPLPEEPGIESDQDPNPGCSPLNDLPEKIVQPKS